MSTDQFGAKTSVSHLAATESLKPFLDLLGITAMDILAEPGIAFAHGEIHYTRALTPEQLGALNAELRAQAVPTGDNEFAIWALPVAVKVVM